MRQFNKLVTSPNRLIAFPFTKMHRPYCTKTECETSKEDPEPFDRRPACILRMYNNLSACICPKPGYAVRQHNELFQDAYPSVLVTIQIRRGRRVTHFRRPLWNQPSLFMMSRAFHQGRPCSKDSRGMVGGWIRKRGRARVA